MSRARWFLPETPDVLGLLRAQLAVTIEGVEAFAAWAGGEQPPELEHDGVDPQSRNAILESVEQLSAEGMAVLYTTHYMEVAERLCDRIGIVDLGELKAEGTRAELVALVGEHDRVLLQGAGDLIAAARASRALEPVRAASVKDGTIELIVDHARSILPELLRSASEAGGAISSVEVKEPDLEAVFLHLTGKQ
jgi:ABC-2 type transport system ATP-binding protein